MRHLRWAGAGTSATRRSPPEVVGCSRSSGRFTRLVVEGIAARLAASTRAAVAAEAAAADAAAAQALAEALVAPRARAGAPLQALSAAAAPEGIRYSFLAHTDVGRLTHRASMYTPYPRSGLTRPGIHDDKANSSPGSKPRILLRKITSIPTRYIQRSIHHSLPATPPPLCGVRGAVPRLRRLLHQRRQANPTTPVPMRSPPVVLQDRPVATALNLEQ